MPFKDLIVEREDRILLLKINRPEVLNALRKDTFLELEQALKEFSGADEYWAMIITGVGDRAFSAGGDIKALAKMDGGDAASFAAMTHRILDRLESIPKPDLVNLMNLFISWGMTVLKQKWLDRSGYR